MKSITTTKRAIAVLMAILMIAAVSTVSAFAVGPDTFYVSNGAGGYTLDTSMAQQMVISASLDNSGVATVVFSDGPYYSQALGGYYVGDITGVTFSDPTINATASITSPTGSVGSQTQTLTYSGVDEDSFEAVTFNITLYFSDAAGNLTGGYFAHPPITGRYINVQ
jgi:hypothetical protein